MKLLSSNFCADGGVEEIPRTFHKNLFLDDFKDSCKAATDQSDDEVEEDDFFDDRKSSYKKRFEQNTKVYRMNHMPIPLTGGQQTDVIFYQLFNLI